MRLQKILAAVIGITIVGGIAAVGLGGLPGSSSPDLRVVGFETVNASCTNVSGDPLPESSLSEPTEDGRRLTIRFAVRAETTDVRLQPTLTRDGSVDGRPAYRLDVSTTAGDDPATCPYGVLYEAQIGVSPAGPYTLRVYHDGTLHGRITQSSGESSSSTYASRNVTES